MIKGQVSAYL